MSGQCCPTYKFLIDEHMLILLSLGLNNCLLDMKYNQQDHHSGLEPESMFFNNLTYWMPDLVRHDNLKFVGQH